MASDTRSVVMELIKKKEQIEKEIQELGLILAQNGIGMNDPLVDAEGFPKANIDIYQVRHARSRIICLQNDHKAIMRQIEEGLGEYYSSTRQSNSAMECEPINNQFTETNHTRPFAKISAIANGSPAQEAGFHNDDLIIEFGSVNSKNFEDITMIANIVRHSINQDIRVKIQRGLNIITTQLRPHEWVGKGLIGCHIAKLESLDR